MKIAFNINTQHRDIPVEFENYLFHENKLGNSALMITQLRNKQANEESVLSFAKEIYGAEDTVGFQRFVSQVNSEGHSALMRAVMKGNKRLVLSLIENAGRGYQSIDTKEVVQHLFVHQDKRGGQYYVKQ